MKEVFVSELEGIEVLGSPIISSSDRVLVHADVVLKNDIIERLKELGVEKVFIKDTVEQPDDGTLYTMEATQEKSRQIVQKILERHIYKQDKNLREVGEEAEKIVHSVLENPEVISRVTEVRNVSTDMYSHCINVCALSTIMALRLRMSERQVHNVSLGGILHDIGLRYVTVPYFDVEIEKEGGQDALEYKKHTIYGYSAIQEENWIPDAVREIILLHHEREDGSGYPFQQSRERLRPEVKLVALCDTFDRLIGGIGSRKIKIYEAIEYIRTHAGIRYDSGVAAKLLSSVALYPVGVKVLTSEGETAVVWRQNEVTNRPVLKMLSHSDGSPYEEEVCKDLMKILTVFIIDTVE